MCLPFVHHWVETWWMRNNVEMDTFKVFLFDILCIKYLVNIIGCSLVRSGEFIVSVSWNYWRDIICKIIWGLNTATKIHLMDRHPNSTYITKISIKDEPAARTIRLSLCEWCVSPHTTHRGPPPPHWRPPPPTTHRGHTLCRGGGLCARCAETNFPAGINQGQQATPPLPPVDWFCPPWFN